MEPPEEIPGQDVISTLSLPARIVIAVAAAVVSVTVALHLTMIFLHVAPSNTLTKQHGDAVDAWVYPEFEQNWKLFAPNPLQQNVHVQVRAEVRSPAGDLRTTGWTDLTARDVEGIRGNVIPSHTQQNELRRAWSYYTSTHDDENTANGERGLLSEQYLRRIAELRYVPGVPGGDVRRIQLRSATRVIPPPAWSGETVKTETSYRVLPWWIAQEKPE